MSRLLGIFEFMKLFSFIFASLAKVKAECLKPIGEIKRVYYLTRANTGRGGS
jgi:hypothetical protein